MGLRNVPKILYAHKKRFNYKYSNLTTLIKKFNIVHGLEIILEFCGSTKSSINYKKSTKVSDFFIGFVNKYINHKVRDNGLCPIFKLLKAQSFKSCLISFSIDYLDCLHISGRFCCLENVRKINSRHISLLLIKFIKQILSRCPRCKIDVFFL